MRVILLAGYRKTSPEDCPWLVDDGGLPRLQKRILEARELSPTRVVVLAGESSDETLRVCPAIESCELVFDTAPGQTTLLTNLRAALRLGSEPSIVLPAEMSFGDLHLVRRLAAAVVQHGLQAPFHGMQALLNGGLPLVLTQKGCQTILDAGDLEGLSDSRLTYEKFLASA